MAHKEPSMMIPAFYTSPFIVMSRAHSILVVHSEVYNLAEKALVLDSAYYTDVQVLFIIWLISSSVNIPWPEKGMGDADYIHAFQKVIMPIAMEFAPELVISEQ
jgi:hypothetical protein